MGFEGPFLFVGPVSLIDLNNDRLQKPVAFCGAISLIMLPIMYFKSPSPFVSVVGFFSLVFVQD